MTTIKKLIATDVLNEDNQLKAIEYHYVNGDFAFQAMWDDNDEHTDEKIKEFREWCNKMAARLGYLIEA